MTDVVLSEAAKSLTPLVPHDVAEDTNSATIVSARRQPKNMRSRVRKVRGSSTRVGRGRLERGNATVVEDKPQYKDYLAEQRARRLQRLKPKGQYEGVDNTEGSQEGLEDDREEIKKGLEDSGRGVSAGSNGSKDEGIHSNGEKDEEHDLETVTTEASEAGQEAPDEDIDDDEGHGSINDEEEEAPASPSPGDEDDEGGKEEDEEENDHSDAGEADENNGYHGDMDEPNSLATSYQDSLALSSDAGLGATLEHSELRSGLDNLGEELVKTSEDGQKEEGETNEPGENELQSQDEGEAEVQGDQEVKGADEGEGEEEKNDEEDKEETEEEEGEEEEEEKSEDEASAKEESASEEKLEEGGEVEEAAAKEENEDVDETAETFDSEKEDEDKTEDEVEANGEGEEMAEDTLDELQEEKEETDHEESENEVSQSLEEEEINEGLGLHIIEEGEEEEAKSDKDGKESEDEEKEEDKSEDISQETDEAKIEVNTEDEDGKTEDEGEEEKEEEEEEEEEETKEDDNEEKAELSQEPKERELTADKEQEEEIQEVPAIAKIPGRYRRRNVPSKIDSLQRKPPQRKSVNRNKVASNRKPISYRSGPIQNSNRPEVSKPGRLQRRTFKAKPISTKKGEANISGPDPAEPTEDATQEPEEDAGDKESQASQEDRVTSTADTESTIEMPPVHINKLGDHDMLGALETSRSVGQLSQDDSHTESQGGILKATSLQDLSRPRTAGKKYRDQQRGGASRKGKSSSSRKSSFTKSNVDLNTSEVWVPEEDKLYVYTYSSQPRLLQVRRMGARVATTHKYDNDPNSSFRLKRRGNGNPMYDRRVVRGSNYAKRMNADDLPKWNPYFSNARSLTQVNGNAQAEPGAQPQELTQSQVLRRQEFRQKLEARARLRRETHGVSSLYPSHGSNPHNMHRSFGRAHAHVQTENYYEPLERPPESEAGVQTDPWTEEGGFVAPVVAPSVPGVDATTQVYDAEIDANSDDDALLAALVGRTMREAVLEVAREEQAEEERIHNLATSSLYFLKTEDASRDQNGEDEDDEKEDEGEKEAGLGVTTEERSEPEGKETTPEGTVEAPRSPAPSVHSPSLKEVDNVTDGRDEGIKA